MGVKKKTQSTNTEDKVTSTQTLYAPIKRRGARISNTKIRNMKGERVSKYKNH